MDELRRRVKGLRTRTAESIDRHKRGTQEHRWKHEQHPCVVRPVRNKGPHRYEVYCLKCDKHVQWAKREMYEAYRALKAKQ